MKYLKCLKLALKHGDVLTLLETNAPHKWVGVPRHIHKLNSIGIQLTNPNGVISYLEWPKASELSYDTPLGPFNINTADGLYLKYSINGVQA